MTQTAPRQGSLACSQHTSSGMTSIFQGRILDDEWRLPDMSRSVVTIPGDKLCMPMLVMPDIFSSACSKA